MVYAPLTRAYFFEDDFPVLFELANDPLPVAILRPFLGHAHAVRNLIFWATLATFGPSAEAFQATVLAGHLVAVALLFVVALRLTDSVLVACLVALVWGTCPTSEGTLGWYSVFGHTLSTIFTLAALAIVMKARDDPRGLTTWRIVACAILLALGATSFGGGLGLALTFPVVLWLLVSRDLARPPCVAMGAIVVATLVAYFGQRLAFAVLGGVHDDGLVGDILLQLPPGYAADLLAQFIGYGVTALVRGPFETIVPWPALSSTAVLALLCVLLLAALVLATSRDRRATAAMLALATAAYGAVVAGRGAQFATIGAPASVMAATLRYHYAAQAFLVLALGVGLSTLLRRVPANVAASLVSVCVVAVLAAHLTRPHVFDHHARSRAATGRALADVRRAAMAAPPASVVRVRNRAFEGTQFAGRSPERFPGIAALFVIFEPDDVIAGRRIVFEASQDLVAAAQRRGGRIATLLVPTLDGWPDSPVRPTDVVER